MKRSWSLLALGIGAFIVFALVTFPASVVLSRLDSSGVFAAGVSGTIWNGKAQVLRVGEMHLGSVEWNLHVLPLFTLHANADLKVTRVDGFAAGDVSVGPGGTVTLENLSASLPLSALPNVGFPPGWKATLNGKFTKLVLENGWPTHLDGSLDIVDVMQAPPRSTNIGSYRVIFDPAASNAEMLQGAVMDAGNGPLLINGKVQLKADRSYAVDALIGTKPDTPQNLAKGLEFLGPPDGEGRRQFSMAGTL